MAAAPPAAAPDWLQDFGQRVDLTARLREVLINYPEGTSILKELIQVWRAACVPSCRVVSCRER